MVMEVEEEVRRQLVTAQAKQKTSEPLERDGRESPTQHLEIVTESFGAFYSSLAYAASRAGCAGTDSAQPHP